MYYNSFNSANDVDDTNLQPKVAKSSSPLQLLKEVINRMSIVCRNIHPKESQHQSRMYVILLNNKISNGKKGWIYDK